MSNKSENLLPPIKMVFDEMYEEWCVYDSNNTMIAMLMTETHARQLCWLVNGKLFEETRYILKEDTDEIIIIEEENNNEQTIN